jgi:hypothetical protein
MNCLCPLVVARLPVISVSHIAELVSAATGLPEDMASLRKKVSHTSMTEAGLLKALGGKSEEAGPFPSRFFKDPWERDHLKKKVSEYDPSKDQQFFRNEETLS